MDLLTELSLFSGAGGGLLATTHLLGWRTVCYVEWDRYAVEVLKARIRDGYLHDAPIWDNACTFDGRPWAGLVDVLTAGFPCQPFSLAGKGLAQDDPRNGWPATIRSIREVRPRLCLLENVPGLISKPYFGAILGELSEAGYRYTWDCISAAEVGANHKRERLWIVANAEGEGERGIPVQPGRSLEARVDPAGESACQPCQNCGYEFDHELLGKYGCPNCEEEHVSHTNRGRRRQQHTAKVSDQTRLGGGRSHAGGFGEWWAVEPELGRVADGVSNRVDRLRAIGNGQVPAVVGEAWRRLNESASQ